MRRGRPSSGPGRRRFVAGQIVAVFGVLRQGAQDLTTDAVRDLTGREPRSFAGFARDHAGLFQAERAGAHHVRKE